jgi:hypothetical protein
VAARIISERNEKATGRSTRRGELIAQLNRTQANYSEDENMSDFEDLLGQPFDLTNVQDVVRRMFEAVARTLRQQSVMLSRIEQKTRDCPSRAEVRS